MRGPLRMRNKHPGRPSPQQIDPTPQFRKSDSRMAECLRSIEQTSNGIKASVASLGSISPAEELDRETAQQDRERVQDMLEDRDAQGREAFLETASIGLQTIEEVAAGEPDEFSQIEEGMAEMSELDIYATIATGLD